MAMLDDSLDAAAQSLQGLEGVLALGIAAEGTSVSDQEADGIRLRSSDASGAAQSLQTMDGWRVGEGVLDAISGGSLDGYCVWDAGDAHGSAASEQSLDGGTYTAVVLQGQAHTDGTVRGNILYGCVLQGAAVAGGSIVCRVSFAVPAAGTALAGGSLEWLRVLAGMLVGSAVSGGTVDGASNIQTHEDKVDAGYPTWLEPRLATATYREIVDVTGDPTVIVPSTNITVTPTWKAVSGDPVLTCKIETAVNGTDDWATLTENGFMVHAENFRFCRYTFTVTGGYAELSSINYHMDVKRKTDKGQAYCEATDGGSGDATGTWIPFNMQFTDIENIEYATENGKIAHLNFQDVSNPQGFRIYITDKQGARQDGWVSWSAYGV